MACGNKNAKEQLEEVEEVRAQEEEPFSELYPTTGSGRGPLPDVALVESMAGKVVLWCLPVSTHEGTRCVLPTSV